MSTDMNKIKTYVFTWLYRPWKTLVASHFGDFSFYVCRS
jgi:hypothetical protein